MKTQGINRSRQKENNIRQIIHLLYRTDSCSRVSLASKMNLTQAAITKLVNPLIESGLVEEVQQINTAAGRKPTQLSLASRRFTIAAGRLNRDYVSVALYSLCGNLIREQSLSFDAGSSPEEVFAEFKKLLGKLLSEAKSPILGLGMAVPGPFNMHSNTVALMSGFAGWNRIDIKKELEAEFNLPVFMEQDANCGAMAELWCGDTGNENLVYVTADRGVGCGIVVDGQIYRGNIGYAGEFGHMSIDFNGPRCECGNHGCLELYCSTSVMENEYAKKTGVRKSASEILALVRASDRTATESYDVIIKYLAFGCASLVNVLNPDELVFADKVTNGGPYFLEAMRGYLRQFLMPELYPRLKISVSRFDGDPTMLGASVIVLDKMLEDDFSVFLDR